MAKSMTITASTRIPVKAKDGTDGSDGNGVKKTTITYQIGSSGTTAPTGTWLADPPTAQKGKYLWTRTVTVFTNNSETVAYSVSYYGSDGENGANGLPGAVSVKKKWVQGDTHVRNNDIVHYLYVDRGTKAASDWYRLAENRTINSAGAPPATSVVPTYYERVTSMMTLQVDAFLANEANVGGFFIKDGVFWSTKGMVGDTLVDYNGQKGFVPNIILDGTEGDVKITGTVNATSGTIENVTITNANIGKWNIVNGSLYSDYDVGASIAVEQTGGRFLRINDSSGIAMLGIRADNDTALRIYTQSSAGVGISISAQTGGRAIDSFGGHNFVQRSVNEWWNAPGMLMALTLELRRMAQVEYTTNIFEHKWHISTLNKPIAKRLSGDVVRLTHNLGHTDYTPHATLNAGGGEVDKIVKYDDYFDMYLAGAWNYSSHRIQITVIGRNKA